MHKGGPRLEINPAEVRWIRLRDKAVRRLLNGQGSEATWGWKMEKKLHQE